MPSGITVPNALSLSGPSLLLTAVGLLVLTVWLGLELYPGIIYLAASLVTIIGLPVLMGLLGWRYWKEKETKKSVGLKLGGIVFLLFPALTILAVFASIYLPTPSESTLLSLLNLRQEERGIGNVDCHRSDGDRSERNKVTCTFTVHTKVGVPHEYQGSIDLEYKLGQNKWEKYESYWR